MKQEQIQKLWQESVTDDLISTICNFANAVEKAAKVAVLREAIVRLPSYNENHAILCRMADELESSLNAGETT